MSRRAVITIVNPQGLHARPISTFVSLVQSFDATVSVRGPDGTVADGSSIFSMMTLAADRGAELVLEAEGEQAEELLAAISKLVAEGFGES
jgi:phosphocarrier protein